MASQASRLSHKILWSLRSRPDPDSFQDSELGEAILAFEQLLSIGKIWGGFKVQ